MNRRHLALCFATALGTVLVPANAVDSGLTQEVHELRRDLQMQTKKIDALSQQLTELGKVMRERADARPAPEPASPTPAVAPPKTVAAPRETKPAAPAPEPEAPKAVPVPPPISHVVAKGETLTGIAKQYNVPLADLLKLNKNTNDRKLQIGQTLKVPAPAASSTPTAPPAETTAEKPPTP
ncbi:MAG: LysM peptidoglycan-binding domain-containing protein [Chthoniobacter sp.]|nr:LysM peptidoglycan-binding domain-containing protein [Chthoniobacter sp.]